MTTVIIRPDGASDYTNIHYSEGAGAHWQLVDEAVADDADYVGTNPLTYSPGDANLSGSVTAADSTYIQQVILGLQPETVECDINYDLVVDSEDVAICDLIVAGTYTFDYAEDSYTLETPSIPAGSTINSVKVYYRGKSGAGGNGIIRPALYFITSTLSYGSDDPQTTSWVTDNQTISRPGGGTWVIADFTNMSLVISLKRVIGGNVGYSQSYVEIDFTEPPEAQIFFML